MNAQHVAEDAKKCATSLVRLSAGSALMLTWVLIWMAASAPAQAQRFTDTVVGSCVYSYGAAHCVRQYRYNDPGNSGIKHYAEPAEEVTEAREREKAWEARCRPTLRQDYYGVNRYVYAAPGCEYGRMH